MFRGSVKRLYFEQWTNSDGIFQNYFIVMLATLSLHLTAKLKLEIFENKHSLHCVIRDDVMGGGRSILC